jgi:hypothetical protein
MQKQSLSLRRWKRNNQGKLSIRILLERSYPDIKGYESDFFHRSGYDTAITPLITFEMSADK